MKTSLMTQPTVQNHTWRTAMAVLPGQLTIAFGMFGVVVALPNMLTAFSTDVQTLQWVMTGYLLARVVPMPAMGWLVSQLGQRNLYVLGVLGTTVSTALCGLAWSVEVLIVLRIVQGAVGAFVMSIGMVLLYEAFPQERRGFAMGLFLMVASLGPTLGQLLGGYLVEHVSWRTIFFLAIPSGVAGTVLPLMYIPRDVPTTVKTVDVPGLCAMTGCLVPLLLVMAQGQSYGWNSGYILALFALSVAFGVLFVLTELRVPNPVVDLRLYRNRPFVLSSVVVFLYNAGFMGANFLVALMVQLVFDFTPLQAGIILAPGALLMGLVGLGAGQLADAVPARYLICLGIVIFAIDMYSFTYINQAIGLVMMAVLVSLQRGAFGMIFSASDTAIMQTLPSTDRNMGAGLHNMHRGIAMAFGVALASMFLETRLGVHQALLVPTDAHLDAPAYEALYALQEIARQAGVGTDAALDQALLTLTNLLGAQVRLAAYHDCFFLLTCVFLGCLLPAWYARVRMPKPATPSAVAEEEPMVVGSVRRKMA